MNTPRDLSKHPCFNGEVKGQFGRIHLPVAPKCNIKCNYCNRKFDCVNESRPGVTSSILSPSQALSYVEKVLEKEPRITVVGIAGPGDPFANPEETLQTMRLIRKRFPDLLLCLSSNGFAIAKHIDEIAQIGVSHVTITVNAVNPEISQKIYGWVSEGKVIHKGLQAAKLLLARQLDAIVKLKAAGITVKINTIVVPGINDHHVVEVAQKMKSLGVDLLNCMALLPNVDTPFEAILEPDKTQMDALRKEAEKYLPQMRHCTRCRADAVGLLGQDRTDEMRTCLSDAAKLPVPSKKTSGRPYIAVATLEGILINQHLGEAETVQIWSRDNNVLKLIEERETPKRGCGPTRWLHLARILVDCSAILVSGIGATPQKVLAKYGVQTYVMNGFIEMGLEAAFNNNTAGLTAMKAREVSCTSKTECAGSGGGCS
ncbi:MAG: nitrogenase cofactor biosynthesis protein NifB [Nitrospira sp.]|nr:nitrogenase cofactor biosynthesis protein NifB [bacterium]MBL7048620.1 nitrogenase cofactor biosynthesis protein NifB [Nitrospira sp.]